MAVAEAVKVHEVAVAVGCTGGGIACCCCCGRGVAVSIADQAGNGLAVKLAAAGVRSAAVVIVAEVRIGLAGRGYCC